MTALKGVGGGEECVSEGDREKQKTSNHCLFIPEEEPYPKQ
jgi:hypothetical protein